MRIWVIIENNDEQSHLYQAYESESVARRVADSLTQASQNSRLYGIVEIELVGREANRREMATNEWERGRG